MKKDRLLINALPALLLTIIAALIICFAWVISKGRGTSYILACLFICDIMLFLMLLSLQKEFNDFSMNLAQLIVFFLFVSGYFLGNANRFAQDTSETILARSLKYSLELCGLYLLSADFTLIVFIRKK